MQVFPTVVKRKVTGSQGRAWNWPSFPLASARQSSHKGHALTGVGWRNLLSRGSSDTYWVGRADGWHGRSIWDEKSVWNGMGRAYGMGNTLWPSLENIICHGLSLATTLPLLQLHIPSPIRQPSFILLCHPIS